MYVAELRFFWDGGTAERDVTARDAVNVWLGALFNNGQLVGEWPGMAESGEGKLTAPALLPASDALDARHDGKYVALARAGMRTAGVRAPSLTLLGRDADEPEACDCAPKRRACLILFTTPSGLPSPVRCGACFGPVPLYTLPPTYNDEEHYGVLKWAADYQACDRLQMGCATGERFGLREVSRVDSSLTRRGREVCRVIEEKTGLPTYYYLFRWSGRSLAAERRRACPGCGGAWLLPERWHEHFDFRCGACRLLSNVAFSLPGR